jgi:hypothetical protein
MLTEDMLREVVGIKISGKRMTIFLTDGEYSTDLDKEVYKQIFEHMRRRNGANKPEVGGSPPSMSALWRRIQGKAEKYYKYLARMP